MPEKSSRPILLTGGAGYVGSHIALALLDGGRDVVVLDNLTSGFRDLVPAGAEFVEGDYGDEVLLDKVLSRHSIGAVIHTAASTSVPESVAEPMAYYQNNVVSSSSLLRACLRRGVTDFVFTSSAAVYGASEMGTMEEAMALAPINPYGATKMMMEYILHDAAAANSLRYVALRCFNIAGADADRRSGDLKDGGGLIKNAMLCVTGARDRVEVYGTDHLTEDETAVRDYIHVSDVAVAHMKALDYLASGRDSGGLNLGLGRGFSVREVIDAVQRVAGVEIATTEAPRREGDASTAVADIRKIRAALGFVPRYENLDEIIATAVAWEREGQARPAAAS